MTFTLQEHLDEIRELQEDRRALLAGTRTKGQSKYTPPTTGDQHAIRCNRLDRIIDALTKRMEATC